MPTTIDTLQIQIESSSANAAQGIRDLGEALGELKKNGSFTTAINNLNKLRDSLRLFNNIPSNASKVLSLSKSLEQLKTVGSVTSIGNSLSKLAESLKSLNTVNVDKGKMDSIAYALSSLSAVKAGGINTMMNGLLKLGKVTESLNDKAIGDFAERVGVLVEKLTPLSEKMTTIQAGLKGINASARSAGGGVKEMADELDTASVNLSSFIYTIQEAVQWLQQAVDKFGEFMRAAVEWDGIHHQFGNSFGEQADEYYAKVVQITDALKINKQNFMEMSAMASSMLIGFGVDTSDAREMGVGYTELAYDIWAAFNNVYKTLEGADGAMAAVRSAIAGEVEPIRRAGFTIVDSQLAMTAANYGLAYSAATATEAQKSYLRYLTLVDQAQSKGIIGTYASEMNKAEGMVRTFSQQLKSLTQAFGSLFIPILVKVMPYLQAFVELLTDAVHAVAAFFGVEIQSVDFSGYSAGAGAINEVANSANGASDAMGSAAKAAKELKNATLGIDELNVISPTKDTAGSGGGGGGVGSGGGGGGYDIPVSSIWDEAVFKNVKDEVAAIKEKLEGWLPVLGAIAGGFAALRLAKLIIDIDDVVKKLKAIFGLTAAGGAAGAVGGGILASIKEFFATAKQMAPEVGWFAALFPKLSGWFASIGTAISGAASAVGTFLAGISAPAWAAIVATIAAVVSVVVFLKEHWDEVTAAVKRFFNENIAPKLEEIKGHFGKVKEALSSLYDAIRSAIQPIIDFAQAWWETGKPLQVLADIFEVVGSVIFSVVSGVIAGAFQTAVGIIEGFVQVVTGLVEIVGGAIETVVRFFSGDFDGALEAVKRIGQGIADVFVGLYDMTIGAVVDFVDGIIDWFIDLWDELVGHSIVPDTINAIVEWFTSLPGKIFGSVKNFVSGVIDRFKDLGSGLTEKFSSAWSAVKSWWGKKPSLKEYTPSIGSIYEKVKDRWNNARDWWNNKKTKLKEYTPSIGSIYDKLSARWKNARDWWNKKKGSLSYTPSIGSFTDRLKSAWNSAKNWWKKNVGGLSTKLDIKVPKIEVKWDTATAFGKSFKYPTGFKLKFAADGGIFDQGSLVWAGERGPEILANAQGGKTGVMNVQQMQDAVYEGVYAAVVAAMRTSGGNNGGANRTVQVLMPDGRVLASTVEKAQRERGANIMGNQVYSYG